jgi:hypothetical protein
LSFFWPESSSSAWEAYGRALLNEGKRLMGEAEGPQRDIYTLVRVDQEGPFIESAVGLIQRRAATLENRYRAYQRNATAAQGVASAIWAAKLHMSESVATAEASIKAAKTELEPQIQAAQSAMQSGLAQALKLELQARINAAIQLGQDEVASAAETGAGAIGAQNLGVTNFTMPRQLPTTGGSSAASPMSNGTGGVPAAPAPTMPATDSPGGGLNVRNVDNQTMLPGQGDHTQAMAQPVGNQTMTPGDNGKTLPQVQPASATMNGTTPGSGASQGSSGGSLIGKMMSPLSSVGGGSSAGGGSPLSSLGGGMGNFGNMSGANPGGAQPASMMNPGGAGLPGAGLGTGAGTGAGVGAGAGQGAGLAGLGSGAAETSAKLAAGAVNGVTNGLNAVANAGSQVAQNVAPAAAQLAAQSTPVNPAAGTAPASMGGMGGAPPMGMMPPGGSMGGAPPVSSVGGSSLGGPGTPSTPPAAPPQAGGAPPSFQGAPPGAQFAPVGMPQAHNGGVGSIGADGATGAVLVDQAMSVGADLIAAMMTQTTLAGYVAIDFAVSLIYERTGGVTAWLATSEGASVIPLGVRIPQDVRLAVTDPLVGRQLWSVSAAGGGANPLQVITEHAKAREMAAPGTKVLAIASAAPDVEGWAKELSTRPVQLTPGAVRPVADLGHTHHRCEIGMPWEWRQANAFDAQERLRIAARHMHMAMTAGHLHGAASEQVLRLFEERKPISDELWAGVHQERIAALVQYDIAKLRISYGAPELARLLTTVRAGEVMESLRRYNTAEGCADLLYSTRLAGAPLSPDAAAVA